MHDEEVNGYEGIIVPMSESWINVWLIISQWLIFPIWIRRIESGLIIKTGIIIVEIDVSDKSGMIH